MRQKILCEMKLSQYMPLNTRMIHTLSYTSTYGNISTPVWVDWKIDSNKSDNYPSWSDQNKVYSNINIKFLWTPTCWTWYIPTKQIYHLYYSLVILNIVLIFFSYDKTFRQSPATVKYHFTWLRKLRMHIFTLFCKYY